MLVPFAREHGESALARTSLTLRAAAAVRAETASATGKPKDYTVHRGGEYNFGRMVTKDASHTNTVNTPHADGSVASAGHKGKDTGGMLTPHASLNKVWGVGGVKGTEGRVGGAQGQGHGRLARVALVAQQGVGCKREGGASRQSRRAWTRAACSRCKSRSTRWKQAGRATHMLCARRCPSFVIQCSVR
eukprot:110185-Chlamydomonas_euryale.AAC.1